MLDALNTSKTAVSWGEMQDDFLTFAQTRYKPSYVKELTYVIGALVKYMETERKVSPLTFKRQDLEKYLAAKQAGGAGLRTLEIIGRRAIVFFRYCCETGHIPGNPLLGFVVAKAPKAFVKTPSLDDIGKLLKAIEDKYDPRKNPNISAMPARRRRFFRTRDYAFVTGLIETGCRVSELCGLLLEDFDADDNFAKRKAKTREATIVFRATKGGEPRRLAVSEEWVAVVKEWLKVRPAVKDCPTLFMSLYGLPLNKDTVKKQITEAEKFGGLPHFTRHSFRRRALTEFAKISVDAACRIAGHKDLAITKSYLVEDAEFTRGVQQQAGLMGKVLQSETPTKQRPKFTARA